ncbi:hypothetical protein JKI95_09200 [Corynebacterium aquatimens]|uniref:hypothetical protein n=1 Tax=Corynebacterium TaxID=1716 RepID=UPI001F2BD064|nr:MULTISPECIES: hypothetical protein [Corynebacterium]QYH19311.1 hypothetical protein JKI95_09200 [Corynebacterium aquatimens]UIZ91792.1 hypothetical protein JZY91_08690 [Corynebacterium sp. CNCTC7651]
MDNELADSAIAAGRTIAQRLRATEAITVADYMAKAGDKERAEMERLLSIVAIYEYLKWTEGKSTL